MVAIQAEELVFGYQRHLADWYATARAEQLPPPGDDWLIWLIMAGRGFGKTRAGAEWLAEQAQVNHGTRWAIVAPTFADCRDTCIEGESGLLSCLEDGTYEWHRSIGELYLPYADSHIKCFAAEEPNRLRGPQHHGAWCDEVSSWRYEDAWDQLMFGMRLGKRPRIACTTTPKPNKLTKTIMADPDVVITRGSTFDNRDNLAPTALKKLREKYEGTRLGRQELNAELLDDVPGALWTRGMLDRCRTRSAPARGFKRIVIGVDPSGSSGISGAKNRRQMEQMSVSDQGDSQGIVAAALGYDDICYILSDDSMNEHPFSWGKAVVDAYNDLEADLVVAEANYGGAMVEAVIKSAAGDDAFIPVKLVTASRGKHIRAEPVAALYEQRRVRHIGSFADLEDQMCNMTSTEYLGGGSPNRLDAMVWAVTELMLDGGKGKVVKVKFG